MITNADITIFNRVLSSDRREVYIPTYIQGVAWYDSHASSESGTAKSESSDYVVRVPESATVTGGKTYVSADDYKALSSSEREGHWTIQLATLVAKGTVVLPEGSTTMDESSIRKSGHEVFSVSTYADNTVRGTAAVRHWRMGGA